MNLRSLSFGVAAAALLSIASFSPASADFIPYPNPGTIAPAASFSAANTGDLVAYFYGTTASYTETLGLEVNGVTRMSGVLNNKTTAPGTAYNFGSVNAGDSLVFFINVLTTGDTFYSDPSRNSDGVNRAYTTTYSGGVNGIPAGTYVGFEDLATPFPSGEPNYNDETFVFTNTMSTVPLPASAPMFGVALLVLGVAGYSVKRKRAATQA